MTHMFIILTVQRTDPVTGTEQATVIKTTTASPGQTRSGLFEWAISQLPARFRAAVPLFVLFFTAEPDQLTPPQARPAATVVPGATVIDVGIHPDGRPP